MTKRELIEALEAIDCEDATELEVITKETTYFNISLDYLQSFKLIQIEVS
jgi:hypothetical protein